MIRNEEGCGNVVIMNDSEGNFCRRVQVSSSGGSDKMLLKVSCGGDQEEVKANSGNGCSGNSGRLNSSR
jgi:hypothetical protein